MPVLLSVAFMTIIERKQLAAHQRRVGPVKWTGKSFIWVKLPNSGDTLKTIVPNYSRKVVSGWTNYSCKVISYSMKETEMGYRGSKSGLIKRPVKEQRVDGSYFGLKNPKLRYTLMGGESRYLVKNPSNQLINRSFSTLNLQSKLNPWEITGFIDAEGSFTITIYPDNRSRLKWAVQPIFTINLHRKDLPIFEEIKNTLQLGNIVNRSKSVVSYKIGSKKELKGLIHHLDKYPLVTCKFSDFLLFKQCFEIIKQKEHLTNEGILKLVGLKSSLNWGLSENLKKAFPPQRGNVITVNRPEYKFKNISDPFWVAGFASGDGSFHLITSTPNTEKSLKVYLRFSIRLNIREEELIKGLANFFKSYDNSSKVSTVEVVTDKNIKNIYTLENSVGLQITKFSDIVNIIIPFFDKYPIEGIKSLDFSDFKKVTEIMKSKEHLTSEGFKKILEIKSSMNQKRSW